MTAATVRLDPLIYEFDTVEEAARQAEISITDVAFKTGLARLLIRFGVEAADRTR